MSVVDPIRCPDSWVPVNERLTDLAMGGADPGKCSVRVLIETPSMNGRPPQVLEITPELVGDWQFATPREVFDVTPEGAASMHRKLGRQGFALECDITGDLRWRDKE